MQDRFGAGRETKAQTLAKAVPFAAEPGPACQRGEQVRDYLRDRRDRLRRRRRTGFGGSLKGQYLVPISIIASYPLRRMATDTCGASAAVRRVAGLDRPQAAAGTPMTAAMNMVGAFLVDWANAHPGRFPTDRGQHQRR